MYISTKKMGKERPFKAKDLKYFEIFVVKILREL